MDMFLLVTGHIMSLLNLKILQGMYQAQHTCLVHRALPLLISKIATQRIRVPFPLKGECNQCFQEAMREAHTTISLLTLALTLHVNAHQVCSRECSVSFQISLSFLFEVYLNVLSRISILSSSFYLYFSF